MERPWDAAAPIKLADIAQVHQHEIRIVLVDYRILSTDRFDLLVRLSDHFHHTFLELQGHLRLSSLSADHSSLREYGGSTASRMQLTAVGHWHSRTESPYHRV